MSESHFGRLLRRPARRQQDLALDWPSLPQSRASAQARKRVTPSPRPRDPIRRSHDQYQTRLRFVRPPDRPGLHETARRKCSFEVWLEARPPPPEPPASLRPRDSTRLRGAWPTGTPSPLPKSTLRPTPALLSSPQAYPRLHSSVQASREP